VDGIVVDQGLEKVPAVVESAVFEQSFPGAVETGDVEISGPGVVGELGESTTMGSSPVFNQDSPLPVEVTAECGGTFGPDALVTPDARRAIDGLRDRRAIRPPRRYCHRVVWRCVVNQSGVPVVID
jgi:hypothetical protein